MDNGLGKSPNTSSYLKILLCYTSDFNVLGTTENESTNHGSSRVEENQRTW